MLVPHYVKPLCAGRRVIPTTRSNLHSRRATEHGVGAEEDAPAAELGRSTASASAARRSSNRCATPARQLELQNGRTLAAWLGLVPRRHSSGDCQVIWG